jgi:hypothetical protein
MTVVSVWISRAGCGIVTIIASKGFAAMKDEKKIVEKPEVEITPEMIEAGARAIERYALDLRSDPSNELYEEVASFVYRRMSQSRLESCG